MKFLTLKPEAFGLDFSDLSLKIAKLRKRGRFFDLASWGEIKLKPGLIEEGEIKNENALAEIIKEGLNKIKGKKLKTRNVIASLPEKKAFLEVIQMPRMKEEELRQAVPFEAENYIPLPIEKVYLDFQVVSPIYPVRDYKSRIKGQREQISSGVYNNLDRLDVLIAALPKETIDFYVSCLKKAGLFLQALEVESQSIARALIKKETSPFPVFIIDFGKSQTSFIIFSGCSLRFTTSIPLSSQKITQAISQTLKVSLDAAEKLKINPPPLDGVLGPGQRRGIKYGSRKKISEDKKIFKAIIPVLTDLVKQIKIHISYYQTHAGREHLPPDGRKIEKILVCGKGANLKGFVDFLSSELKMPVEFGNPWVNILPQPLKEVPELSFKESLGYTTALGLALRGTSR